MNFIYHNDIIGEILLTCGQKPINHGANLLMNQLKKAPNVAEFKSRILISLNNLAESGKVFVPKYNAFQYKERQEEIAAENKGKLTEVVMSKEEKRYYTFNRQPDV